MGFPWTLFPFLICRTAGFPGSIKSRSCTYLMWGPGFGLLQRPLSFSLNSHPYRTVLGVSEASGIQGCHTSPSLLGLVEFIMRMRCWPRKPRL